ncbi:MAG: metal ABC transporter substrate-binding protein [Kiritimatiellae bacterium]|nr:metal ABC transporter substrate-binding protein [Kiritimatiellia bacterium]
MAHLADLVPVEMQLVAPHSWRTIEGVYVNNPFLGLGLVLLLLTTFSEAAPLRIVATTSLIADVAAAVGGNDVEVTELIPRTVDPHAYEPTPRDMARLQNADVIFANGLGLESFLDRFLAVSGATHENKLVIVSAGRTPRTDEQHGKEITSHHDHGETDPHVWFDPTWVQLWVENITSALAERDPEHASTYRSNAASYHNQLSTLDGWIRKQFDAIQPQQRIIVTEHNELGYLADRYGVTVIGTLLPNFTALTESSARSLALLQKQMQDSGARVVVVSYSANSTMAERLARDTGARVVRIYTHSLAPIGSDASNYLSFMSATTTTLTDALREEAP